MTLDRAIDLAKLIAAHPGFYLVAIGRFVDASQLPHASRWGVAVLSKGSESGRPVVIWEPAGWEKLSGEGAGPRRDTEHRTQPSLF